MPIIPLEDQHLDILGKAQRGLGLSDEALLAAAGISAAELAEVRTGSPEAPALRKLARPLRLGADALLAAARKSWHPQPVTLDGLAQFNTAFEDMTVNAYLVWDPASRSAVAFDTGADASGLLELATARGLKIELVLLTHTHEDHVADLPRLLERSAAPCWVHSSEPFPGATPFEAGREFRVGSLRIESRHTHGHSTGGITYVVHGLAAPLAIVGDALFAGSMGGGKVSFADALRTNAEQILPLPDATVLAPGHGPLTTLGEEKRHNPFLTD
jgi:hydroxyacylglutathione hydrolase